MINQPNYTQCPNVFFDEILKDISGAEAKVFCVIMRKTFGWQKSRDRISYSQIMDMSGIASRETVSKAIKGLEKRGCVIAERVGQSITFCVNVQKNEPVQESDQYRKCTASSTEIVPVGDKTGTETVHTKEIDIKKPSKESYSEIEESYIKAFSEVLPDRTPIIDYPSIRKRIRSVLQRIPKDKIIAAIDKAKKDEWIVNNGFSLLTVLSEHQLSKLINGRSKYETAPKKKPGKCVICGSPLLPDYEEPHCSNGGCPSYA